MEGSIVVRATSFEIGYLQDATTMSTRYSVSPGFSNRPIKLKQNSKHRTLEIMFPVALKENDVCYFKIRLSTTSELKVLYTENQSSGTMLIHADSVPEFFVAVGSLGSLDNQSSWTRHGNVRPLGTPTRPTSLDVPDAIVNVGRWTTYFLAFNLWGENGNKFFELCRVLKDFNIPTTSTIPFRRVHADVKSVWKTIDRQEGDDQPHSVSLQELLDRNVVQLPFEVRYQLEVCLSERCLDEYAVPLQFLESLVAMDSTAAAKLLEDVVARQARFSDPMDIFDPQKLKKTPPKKSRLPRFCATIRNAVVTPSTVHFTSPAIEISNRVIRRYSQYSDHFLRVKFAEESGGRIFWHKKKQMLFDRVEETLEHGIRIGERHYEFLAFGNSQIREHSAYFFHPTPQIKTNDIRAWMGNFEGIKTVGKYAARLGQCFSTTRAVTAYKTLVEIEDVYDETGRYNFTDGVGKISKALAIMAANEMKIPMPNNEPPSVLQFRLAGCKGVLTVWDDLPGVELHVRPSQYKFYATYEGLEVVRWSQFSAAHLNQQIILVLSTLGVEDSVFLGKLRAQLASLQQAMTNERIALDLLQKEVDPNQMTLTLAQMIRDGFRRSQDPFLTSLLSLWRAWNTKFLKEKAKIVIHNGGVFLGCTDEARVLKGHREDLQPKSTEQTEEERLAATPEIFLQLSNGKEDKPQILEGYMILARNPSLHPGDIRVVRAVDKKELRHLKDVVVLPQKGDRDIASMCSGGDLDGDDYLVIWDEGLLPRIWNHSAMDFTGIKAPDKDQITIQDVKRFFVDYMENDSLSGIALAHRAQADKSLRGVMDPKCLELAKLHSQAVDFPKSGQPAVMDPKLRPPLWPHWMGRRRENSYHSKKILGNLYDEVELVDFDAEYTDSFDNRVLSRYPMEEITNFVPEVSDIKKRYDQAVLRIMTQYDIKTECEVWSTFVLQHIKHQGSDFKFHETMGQLTTALKETYRDEILKLAGGSELKKLGPVVAAMYLATQQELRKAIEDESLGQAVSKELPMISFPWIFHTTLGRIANEETYNGVLPASSTIEVLKPATRPHTWVSASEDPLADTLMTSKGAMHQGDDLILFGDEDDSPAVPIIDAEAGPGGKTDTTSLSKQPQKSVAEIHGMPRVMSPSKQSQKPVVEDILTDISGEGQVHVHSEGPDTEMPVAKELDTTDKGASGDEFEVTLPEGRNKHLLGAFSRL